MIPVPQRLPSENFDENELAKFIYVRRNKKVILEEPNFKDGLRC